MIKNWIVLAPMRSGSKLIVDVIRNYYLIEKYLKYFYLDPNTKFVNINPTIKSPWILHSHTVEEIQEYINSDAIIVLNDRDILESVLSRLIVDQTKKWHHYRHSTRTIVPFTLDLYKFIEYYNHHLNFKKVVKNYKNKAHYILDYSLFKNDPMIITKQLNLSIKRNNEKYNLSIKYPESYDKWFINWNQVKGFLLEYHNLTCNNFNLNEI